MPDFQAVNQAGSTYPTNGLAAGAGTTFTITQPFVTITIDDDDGVFDGDIATNETPDDANQTINLGGTDLAAVYEYAFTASDGTTTYEFAVVDVDLNNDGDIGNGTVAGADPGEQALFLVVIGPSVPDIPPGGLTFTVVTAVSNNTNRPYSAFICFAGGTLIETAAGPVPVQHLRAGDLVRTRDSGMKRLDWVGARTVAAEGAMTPVHIPRGALGNDRDLVVSPQHRVLMGNAVSQLMFGAPEILVPARALVGQVPGVRVDANRDRITYFHLLFDRHELVWSEGILTESFHPGHHAMDILGEAARAEILTLFPDLMNRIDTLPSARPSVRPWEAAVFLGRAGTGPVGAAMPGRA